MPEKLVEFDTENTHFNADFRAEPEKNIAEGQGEMNELPFCHFRCGVLPAGLFLEIRNMKNRQQKRSFHLFQKREDTC